MWGYEKIPNIGSFNLITTFSINQSGLRKMNSLMAHKNTNDRRVSVNWVHLFL